MGARVSTFYLVIVVVWAAGKVMMTPTWMTKTLLWRRSAAWVPWAACWRLSCRDTTNIWKVSAATWLNVGRWRAAKWLKMNCRSKSCVLPLIWLKLHTVSDLFPPDKSLTSSSFNSSSRDEKRQTAWWIKLKTLVKIWSSSHHSSESLSKWLQTNKSFI